MHARTLAALRDELPRCAGRPAEHLCNFFVGQAVLCDPGNDESVRRCGAFEAQPATAEAGVELCAPQLVFGLRDALRRQLSHAPLHIFILLIFALEHDFALRSSQPVEQPVSQNRLDPRQELRFPFERGTAHPHLDKGFLDEVAREIRVAQAADRLPEEGLEIAAIEQPQGSFDRHASFAARAHEGGSVQGIPEIRFEFVSL